MAARHDESRSMKPRHLCFLELVISRRGAIPTQGTTRRVVMFERDEDTLSFVQEEMDAIISNVMKVTVMERTTKRRIEETSRLFETTLDPWFSLLAQTGGNGKLLNTMATSLKKALILLAMERFHCDEVSVAQALGISVQRLEREMIRCGILSKAA